MSEIVGDLEYVRRFNQRFPPLDRPPSPVEYASPERYDQLYMGEDLSRHLVSVSNDNGKLAWGLSSRMLSLNEMFRATGSTRYLRANLSCIREVLRARDDVRGKRLWTDRIVPAWGCDKYAERGRTVFAVHTGIISAIVLDFILMARSDAIFLNFLGDEAGSMLDCVEDALKVHDPQWREGPECGEGHYIGLDQERACEGKPLPGNRLSAMGWALWLSWRATRNCEHRKRAISLGRYIKNRLTPSPDGAYYWSYWLPERPVACEVERVSIKGEDTSHAGLTLTLPMTLGSGANVFSKEDMERFAGTVKRGFARMGGGILFGRITGQPDLDLLDNIGYASRWLPLTAFDPGVRDPLLQFYLRHKPVPRPLELAQIILYA